MIEEGSLHSAQYESGNRPKSTTDMSTFLSNDSPLLTYLPVGFAFCFCLSPGLSWAADRWPYEDNNPLLLPTYMYRPVDRRKSYASVLHPSSVSGVTLSLKVFAIDFHFGYRHFNLFIVMESLENPFNGRAVYGVEDNLHVITGMSSGFLSGPEHGYDEGLSSAWNLA
ncbi:hypothetical protein V8F06_004482 [Rhypophila decipiens]